MILRRLTDADSREHNKVAAQAYCFGCDIDSNAHLTDAKVIGAFDGNNLMADMRITDAENYFEGSVLTCAGVGGVASKPEYRNRGAVRKLFEAFFNGELIEQKYDISILYPFSEAYYRKFGYEVMSKSLELTVPLKELGSAPKNSDVELFDGSNTEALCGLYNAAAQKFNLAFRREGSCGFSPDPYGSSSYTYMWKNTAGEFRSLVNYSVDRPNKTVYVDEIYYLDRESLAGILGFLRNYEGNQETVVFKKLPLNTPVLNFISNEKPIVQKGFNMGCARIIDVESVLNKKKYPDGRGHFTVQITGDTVEANNAVFGVEYENGRAEVKRTDKEADFILEPTAAAKIILSGVAGEDAFSFMNGVKMQKNNGDFFKAFNVRNTFFCDGF